MRKDTSFYDAMNSFISCIGKNLKESNLCFILYTQIHSQFQMQQDWSMKKLNFRIFKETIDKYIFKKNF